MKNWLKPILIFILAAGILGVTAMLSGVIPVSASGGHWKITAWLLSFSMKRSVSAYSLMVQEKDISSHEQIIRGAGHFELGCRHCHGGPETQSLLGLKSTPKAPWLSSQIKNWDSAELFRIVKHGVKFTGMPAWPDQKRDDEVWDMIAFLKKLPELDRSSYAKIVYGSEENFKVSPFQYSGEFPEDVIKTCRNCHGEKGQGRENAFPILAGQNEEYLIESMKAYKTGKRHSGTMQLVSHSLENKMITALAQFYSSQKKISSKVEMNEDQKSSFARGERIARKGIPDQKVASCIGCHGPDSEGRTRKPHFPDLRGQPAGYLAGQMKLFLTNTRGGTPHLKLMKKAVPNITDEQIRDVSFYYSSLIE